MEKSWSTDADPQQAPWFTPRRTSHLPGCGGVLLSNPQDFIVDERLPYPLSGDGAHLYVRIEKRGVDTLSVVRCIAENTGIKSEDIGVAGLKDRWSIAQQWLSMPDAVGLESTLARLENETFRIVETTRHVNKLRRGHVAANRFIIRLSAVPVGGLERARATLELLKQVGLPNAFGRQRFGRFGDNPRRGLALLRGRKRRRGRLDALMLSSVQSMVFNRVLATRLSTDQLGVALVGDVMQKHDSHGLFEVIDAQAEQARVDQLAISATGPIIGKRMRQPTGAPGQAEADALIACGLSEADTARFGRGTRRPLRIPCDPQASVRAVDTTELEVTFELPSGSYATVLLDELVKPEDGAFQRAEATTACESSRDDP
ncbi:MAG: tRNA pseudouridine(13) synthase TruD [Myxococcota bacterium]